MSLLYLRARPIVAFDATKSEHRRYYQTFIKTQTWGHCPVRFMVESLNTDLVSHINEKMLAWYIEQEFKNGKVTRTKNAKSKPSGTSGTVRAKQSVPTKSRRKQTKVQTQA
jgi:hypothetical protein